MKLVVKAHNISSKIQFTIAMLYMVIVN